MQQALIEKYGEARLPRYTSYPTGPAFSPTVGAGTHGDWLAAIKPGTDASVYVHIAFCRSMCWY
ncbi:oxygen-independent coproporphyrinogen III oxidase, partial [Escherichia coli]|nr:oxygen-independent coproporphyrinogen III oxidase [Escherichia coli]